MELTKPNLNPVARAYPLLGWVHSALPLEYESLFGPLRFEMWHGSANWHPSSAFVKIYSAFIIAIDVKKCHAEILGCENGRQCCKQRCANTFSPVRWLYSEIDQLGGRFIFCSGRERGKTVGFITVRY